MDYDDDEIEDTEQSIEESESNKSNEESEEITYKKRGPKKRIVKKNPKTSLQLNDSDVDSETDFFEMEKTVIVQKNKKNKNNNNKNTLNTPWIEKYRPVTIEDLVLDEGMFNKIAKILDDKDMPNMIITGVPGVGKTTTISCIAKNLLGKFYGEAVLELNASDDRGIKTVQESIEHFCKKKIYFDDTIAQHKIVILDEADNMTIKAQQSIKNLMKNYHDTTRFAFTCNNSSYIIESIQSRCIIFKYSKLTNIQVANRIKKICSIEEIPYTEDGIKTLVETSQGDLRKAINNLQLTYNGYTEITPENVYKLCDKPHPLVIQNIFLACRDKDIKKALELLSDLHNKGYSSSDVSLSMINTLRDLDKKILDERTKIRYIEEVSKTCIIISQGVSSQLQLTACICRLYKLEKI
ncbi:replication factor C small subunit [Klosneuvirus KNV1]|uniref:Replication factor C small subunit n=1 Tax=Klosneuvirus KNV1 TaxID=1977640 RepID=A0A1V0SLV7_9VIRU|nr:replication factor C small subunit [Klosneuvirus KNV1]